MRSGIIRRGRGDMAEVQLQLRIEHLQSTTPAHLSFPAASPPREFPRIRLYMSRMSVL